MIYITGSDGQLGHEFKNIFSTQDAIFLNRQALDLSNLEALEKFLANSKIQTFIHTAAFTDVEKAENDLKIVNTVNVESVKLIARYASKRNFKFVYYSTDYVFDGAKKTPYLEEDKCNPLNVYGKSKYQSELIVQKECPDAIIIRTSWVYSEHGNNFVKKILELAATRTELKIIDDQIGSPTFAQDLANATAQLLKHNCTGLFHYANNGEISWFEFAKEILNLKKIGIPVIPIKSHEYPSRAQRPKYSVLNTDKIKNISHITIPDWKESLRTCLKL